MLYLQIASPKSSVLNFLDSNSFEVIISIFQRTEKVPDMERLLNFKTIGDYIILICYYLKLLKVSKTEIKSFIREFEKITREYEASVNPNVSAITTCHRMDIDF